MYLVAVGDQALQRAMVLAEELHDQLGGARIEMNLGGGSFKSQLKRADKSLCRWQRWLRSWPPDWITQHKGSFVDDLQSEKEQLEEMRAWWSEYGKVIIAGVVIAIAGLIGYNQYQSAQLATQMEASERFETLVGHIVNGDMDGAEFVADDLVANYADTAYAAQSKLALARLYMDQNRDQDAAETLQQLLAMSADENLQNIGRLRLASILLYQDKAQDVIRIRRDE